MYYNVVIKNLGSHPLTAELYTHFFVASVTLFIFKLLCRINPSEMFVLAPIDAAFKAVINSKLTFFFV